jgi:hypothetical protein
MYKVAMAWFMLGRLAAIILLVFVVRTVVQDNLKTGDWQTCTHDLIMAGFTAEDSAAKCTDPKVVIKKP